MFNSVLVLLAAFLGDLAFLAGFSAFLGDLAFLGGFSKAGHELGIQEIHD